MEKLSEKLCVYGEEAFQIAKAYEAESEKRIAELAQELKELRGDKAELVDEVATLQSQLAWTPVSDGLPTEPGVYEFYDARATFENQLMLCELLREPPVWQDEEGDEWNQVEFVSYVTSTHTHYRRITLPERET